MTTQHIIQTAFECVYVTLLIIGLINRDALAAWERRQWEKFKRWRRDRHNEKVVNDIMHVMR